VVIGRIYEREKKNQVLNLKQFPKGQNDLSEPGGSNASAKKIATDFGLSQATVRFCVRLPGK